MGGQRGSVASEFGKLVAGLCGFRRIILAALEWAKWSQMGAQGEPVWKMIDDLLIERVSSASLPPEAKGNLAIGQSAAQADPLGACP